MRRWYNLVMKIKLPKLPNLPKRPKLPVMPHMPKVNLERMNNLILFFQKHKISISASASFIVFIFVMLISRDYVMSKLGEHPQISGQDYFAAPSDSPLPTVIFPSSKPSEVLGNSTYSPPPNNAPPVISTLFPTFAPLPSIVPVATPNIVIPTVTNNNSSSSNNSSNPNCTTGAGVPNTWYSDVYPNPPITTNTGSVTLIVDIRDCSINLAPVSDTISVSLSSGDPNTKVNGNSLPTTVTTTNGEVKFSVSSQLSGTVTLVVQDTTRNFTVTDVNNHNPVITFSGSSSGSSGNSNCTTGAGVPNTWYSDVYPTSPVSANTGSSATFSLIIRDCNKNTVSSTENITVTQTSNDSSFTVNGSSSPGNFQAVNGQATFTISSQNAGTDSFTVRDTTSSFNITDTNNNNPSVVFSGSTSSPAPSASPTPSPSSGPSPSPSPTPTPTPSSSSSPTPSPS